MLSICARDCFCGKEVREYGGVTKRELCVGEKERGRKCKV